MRDMIINSLEKLVWLMVALIILGAVVAGLGTMFSPMGGFFRGLIFLVGGVIYAIVFGGKVFLFIGIHDNTKRTAEAVEKMSNR